MEDNHKLKHAAFIYVFLPLEGYTNTLPEFRCDRADGHPASRSDSSHIHVKQACHAVAMPHYGFFDCQGSPAPSICATFAVLFNADELGFPEAAAVNSTVVPATRMEAAALTAFTPDVYLKQSAGGSVDSGDLGRGRSQTDLMVRFSAVELSVDRLWW